MNSLNYLKSILKIFKQSELKLIEKFILYQLTNEEKEKSKSSQLLNLLLSPQAYSSKDIQKLIYGKVNYAAFNKLINRLKEKVLEVLIFESSLKQGNYAERSKSIFHLRKKMIQIDLLILKGVREKIIEELNSVIKKASELEIYDVLVQALYTKQRFKGFDISEKKADAIKVDIKNAELKWRSVNTSQSIFNDLTNKISISSSSDSYVNDLKDALVNLQIYYEQTQSPTIRYYYLLLHVEEAQIRKNYKEAGRSLEDLLDLVTRRRSVNSEYRLGSTNLNLANNYLYLKMFDECLSASKVAKSYFKGQVVNLSVLSEIEFYAYFYKSDVVSSKEISKSMLDFSRGGNSPLIFSKINYYFATVHFVIGEFEIAMDKYRECENIDRDREGWNIIKRIMVTLCRIELGDYESVDLSISSLDKFIKRVSKTKHIRSRYILIMRILRKLINENLDYKKVYKSRKKYFELLESQDEMYKWEIMSPELIVFEEWFKSKMNNKYYNHKEVMKRTLSIL